jgi:hypothetical protein
MPGHQGDSMQPQAEVIEEPRSSRDAPSIPSQQSNSALHGLPALARARWPEWATIAFFAALVAFAIPYHEPWSDEAQHGNSRAASRSMTSFKPTSVTKGPLAFGTSFYGS